MSTSTFSCPEMDTYTEQHTILAKGFENEDLAEVDVKQCKPVPLREMRSFKVKRVVSPFEFYLEYDKHDSSRTNQMDYQYDEWFPLMQKFYNHSLNQEGCQLKYGVPLQGQCYVCLTPGENQKSLWHRVRVHKVSYDKKLATVFYCDLGKHEQVAFLRLRLLKAQFCYWDAQIFRCKLYHVLPINYEKTGLVWSSHACVFFKEFLMGKEKKFKGAVFTRSTSIVCAGMPENYADLEVVLFEQNTGKEFFSNSSVNDILITKGYASGFGIFARSKLNQMELELRLSRLKCCFKSSGQNLNKTNIYQVGLADLCKVPKIVSDAEETLR